MNDDGKTKAQLIKEPGEMHRQVAGSETAQQQSNHPIPKMNAMIKAFDGLIYVCSRDYRVEFMNEHLISRTGYDGAGELCYKVLHERDSICPWCVNDRVLKGETVRWEVKSPKDKRWYYIVNTPIDNKDGTISKQAMILDITDRKQAEEALRESEETYRSILNASPDDFTITDIEGYILMVSPAAKKMYGYQPEYEGFKGLHVSNFIAHEDRERAKSNIRLILQGVYTGPNEYRAMRKDQSIFDIEVNSGLVHDANGQPVKMVFVVRDITDRKQMEADLQESKRRLADIIDFLPDATFAIDLTGKVIAWNRAMEEMTDVKSENILGKDNYEYALAFYGMRRPMLVDLVFGFAEEIAEKYDFVQRNGDLLLAEGERTIRGMPHALWGKAGPLYDSRGNVVGAIESIRDITELKQAQQVLRKAHDELESKVRERTAELVKANKVLQREISERKRAEAVLKESEEKYNQFFKTSRDCVFITSKDGRLVDLNDAAVELFGYSSRDELLQKKMPYVYANKEERAKHARVIAECGYVKEYPIDLRRKDGSVRHALITAVARYDVSGRTIGFQGTIRDVTEQRRVEKELRKYREDLESMVAERTSELEDKTRNLQEVNTTLNVLLQKREEDRKILEENLVANISSLVLPYIGGIRRNNLDAQQQLCLDTIEKNLSGIVSPLLKNIRQFELTPREIQIVSLIKDGKTTKEIASALGIGEGSIDTHRKNIRKKMGLNRACNLQSHLRFLEK